MLIFKNRIVVTFTLGVQLYRTWVVVTGFKKKKKKKNQINMPHEPKQKM